MASGGARARSGPAPDPNALRRDRDRGDWVRLPPAGREGPTPAWPLSRATKRELAIWADEWRRPQAVMWEQRGQALEVALYVRAVGVAESRTKATSADRRLVLTYLDDLGISQGGLAKNRWKIEAAPAPSQLRATGTEGRPSIRERMKVVQGGA